MTIPADNPDRPVLRSERSAATEQRLLDAAEAAFARRGLEGTRVREIAEAASVNGATLYNYYPSKNALYEAVLERGVRPLSDLLARFSGDTHHPEPIHRLVEAVVRHLAAHPHLSRLVYLEAIAEGSCLERLAQRWFHPLLRRIIEELAVSEGTASWEKDLHPAVATLFLHVSFGHFALAPLIAESLDTDPLSAEGIEHQIRFIEQLIHKMFPQLAGGPTLRGNPQNAEE